MGIFALIARVFNVMIKGLMQESIVQKRVAKLIQQELGDIFSHELTYVSGAFLTVSQVRVPPDLGLAKVFISVLPDSRLQEVASVLNEQAWEIRIALSKRIRNKLRKMPELRFYADDSFKEAERINRLLDNMEISEEDEPQDPSAPQT